MHNNAWDKLELTGVFTGLQAIFKTKQKRLEIGG